MRSQMILDTSVVLTLRLTSYHMGINYFLEQSLFHFDSILFHVELTFSHACVAPTALLAAWKYVF